MPNKGHKRSITAVTPANPELSINLPERVRERIQSSSSSESTEDDDPRTLVCPPQFQKIKSSNRGQLQFAVWSKEKEKIKIWDKWWKRTAWRRANSTEKIIWASRTKSDVWDYYSIVASIADGSPHVICNRCKKALDHPHIAGNGPSAMNKHLKSKNCVSRSATAGLQPLSGFITSKKSVRLIRTKFKTIISLTKLGGCVLPRNGRQDRIYRVRVRSSMPTSPHLSQTSISCARELSASEINLSCAESTDWRRSKIARLSKSPRYDPGAAEAGISKDFTPSAC